MNILHKVLLLGVLVAAASSFEADIQWEDTQYAWASDPFQEDRLTPGGKFGVASPQWQKYSEVDLSVPEQEVTEFTEADAQVEGRRRRRRRRRGRRRRRRRLFGRRRKGFFKKVGNAVKKAGKAVKKTTKVIGNAAKKAAEKTWNGLKKGVLKAANSAVKKIKKPLEAVTKPVKKAATTLKKALTAIMTPAKAFGQRVKDNVKFGCKAGSDKDTKLVLKIPNPAKIQMNPIKPKFLHMDDIKVKICKKPEFKVKDTNKKWRTGTAAFGALASHLKEGLAMPALTFAKRLGKKGISAITDFSKNFSTKDSMLVGPSCSSISTWAVQLTISLGGGVGGSGVGVSIGAEVGIQFGCMDFNGKRSSRRLVLLPVWGFGAALSVGMVSSGGDISINAGFIDSYSYYADGQSPFGGISLGFSGSMDTPKGEVGLGFSADFGIPPIQLVVKTKKVKVPLIKKEFKLPIPHKPYIQTTWGGCTVSMVLIGFEEEEQELAQVQTSSTRQAAIAGPPAAKAAQDKKKVVATRREGELAQEEDEEGTSLQFEGELAQEEEDEEGTSLQFDISWGWGCRFFDKQAETKCLKGFVDSWGGFKNAKLTCETGTDCITGRE